MTALERLQRAQEGMTAVFTNPDVRAHTIALEYAVSALVQWAIEYEERGLAPTLPPPKDWTEQPDPFRLSPTPDGGLPPELEHPANKMAREVIRAEQPTLPDKRVRHPLPHHHPSWKGED